MKKFTKFMMQEEPCSEYFSTNPPNLDNISCASCKHCPNCYPSEHAETMINSANFVIDTYLLIEDDGLYTYRITDTFEVDEHQIDEIKKWLPKYERYLTSKKEEVE